MLLQARHTYDVIPRGPTHPPNGGKPSNFLTWNPNSIANGQTRRLSEAAFALCYGSCDPFTSPRHPNADHRIDGKMMRASALAQNKRAPATGIVTRNHRRHHGDAVPRPAATCRSRSARQRRTAPAPGVVGEAPHVADRTRRVEKSRQKKLTPRAAVAQEPFNHPPASRLAKQSWEPAAQTNAFASVARMENNKTETRPCRRFPAPDGARVR